MLLAGRKVDTQGSPREGINMSTEPQRPTQPAPEVPGQRDQPSVQQPPGQPVRGQPVRGQPAPGQPPPRKPTPEEKAKRTRISATWVAIAGFAVVLLLLLVFILENNQSVKVSFFGAHGHLPLGVALLLAAVCGILLTVIAGSLRILQLRTQARRRRKARKKQAAGQAPAQPR